MEFLEKIENLTGEELKMTYEEFLAQIDSPFFSLSASSLAQFYTPFNFALYKMRKKDNETRAMLVGSIAHCLLLEKQNFNKRYIVCDTPAPRSKNQKEFCEQLAYGIEICEAYKIAYNKEKNAHEIKAEMSKTRNEIAAEKEAETRNEFLATQTQLENELSAYKSAYTDIIECITNENILEAKKLEKIELQAKKYSAGLEKIDIKFKKLSDKFNANVEKNKQYREKNYDRIANIFNEALESYEALAFEYEGWLNILSTKGERQLVQSSIYNEAFEIVAAVESNKSAQNILSRCQNFETKIDFSHSFDAKKDWLFTGFVDAWGYDEEKRTVTLVDLKKRVTADPKRLKYEIEFGDIGTQLVIYALALLNKLNRNKAVRQLGLGNIEVYVLTCDNSAQNSIVRIKPETMVAIYNRLELKMYEFNRCVETSAWGQSYEFFSTENDGEYII